MKLTNKEIIDTVNALNKLAEKELPIKTSYKILSDIENLMNKYNVYDKARQKTKSDKELIDLLNIEVDVDVETIKKKELEEADIKLSPVTLLGLKRLIDG